MNTPAVGLVDVVAPVLVAGAFIAVASLLREPTRQRFMAILVAGAGAAYFNGGLGAWELVYTSVATYVAFLGLSSYRFIALAWLMHTGWDAAHHLWGSPIISFAPMSSFQCAICDVVIAAWFFFGARSLSEGRRATASGLPLS
jgi:hypothetical protein